MDEKIIRPARREDCLDIARLYRISSDGVADYVWSKLAQPGEDLLQVGEHRYQREDTQFSYQNCTIVELDSKVIGMLVAFPMFVDTDYGERDPVLAPYAVLEEDNSYYVCGVALFPEYRGRGIGTELMRLAESDAAKKGFTKVSLIVFEQNIGAKKLYDQLGYEVVSRNDVVGHPLIHYTGEACLMVKHLEK